ncbi:MAG TPA: SulP family inorganic anion transporter [Pyrinomonadaceae bacterium]|jgi:SulP family sulfate permease|nr:SulP family inorganic anion transporter [Pyrinomonadaceae bacterium]
MKREKLRRAFAGNADGWNRAEPPVYHIKQRASGLFAEWNETGALARLFPPRQRRAAYGLAQFKGDVFGGLISALMSVPYGIALSLAMGLGPEAGLYSSIIGGLISGLLSSSPVMISGLSASAVPILGLVIKEHGVSAALTVGVLTGAMMTLLGWLRLGRFANYLPPSVVSAFTCGLGLIILTSQLKMVFGVSPAPTGFDLGIVDDLYGVAVSLGRTRPQSLLIGGVVIATMALLPKWKDNVPSSLVGVLLAAGVAALGGFDAARVGTLPAKFPELRAFAFDVSLLPELLHSALTLTGLFTINQVLTGIVVGRLEERGNGELNANRELRAQGIANMVTPFFGAPPGVAMLARTVASARAGAVTRISVVTHSLVLLLLILPLRGLIGQIPLAALAGVTVMVGFQLIDWKWFFRPGRVSRTDLTLFMLTFWLVVLTDLIVGVGIGFFIAMVLFIERSAEPTHLDKIPRREVESWPVNSRMGVRAYRLVGPLFFASSEKLLSRLEREAANDLLLLDLGAAGLVDAAAPEFFKKVAQRQKERGGALLLANLGKQHLFMFEKGGLLAEIGSSAFAVTASQAASPGDYAQLISEFEAGRA